MLPDAPLAGPPPARRPAGLGAGRLLLCLVLLASLLRGAAWSVVVPPFQPNDEAQHLLRVRSVAGDLPVNPPTATDPPTVPLDLLLLGKLAGFGTLERDRDNRVAATSAESASLKTQMADPAARRAGVPDPRGGLVRHRAFNSQHPPLFYWLLALPYRLMGGLTAGGQLLGLRLFGGLIGLAVVLSAWAVGRAVWPRSPASAGALAAVVAFFPTSSFHLAAVNNEALNIALFSGALAVLAGAMRGPLGWGRAAALAGLTAAGLLTKASFLAILPLYACAAAWQLGVFARRRRTLAAWAVVAAVAAGASAWWYVPVLTGEGGITGHFGRPETRPAPLSVWNFARSGLWDRRYRRVLKEEYWGLSLGNAYMDTDARVRRPVRRAMLLLTGLGWAAAAGWLGWRIIAFRRSPRRIADPPAGALLAMAGASFFLLGFYLCLDYRFTAALGKGFIVRGQYLMPAIAGAVAVAAFGWSLLRPPALRAAALWLPAAGSVAVNLQTLRHGVGGRYYGDGSLWQLCRLVGLVQPVAAGWVMTLFIALALACIAMLSTLAIALWIEVRRDGAVAE